MLIGESIVVEIVLGEAALHGVQEVLGLGLGLGGNEGDILAGGELGEVGEVLVINDRISGRMEVILVLGVADVHDVFMPPGRVENTLIL